MKNNLFLSIISPILFSAAVLHANIVEKKHMSSVKEYVRCNQKGLCVVFDLDNTVMHPTKDEGSDEWFSGYVQYYVDQGMSRNDAITKVLPDLFRFQRNAVAKPVEPEVVTLIRNFQKKKIHVIGLTARSCELIDCTIKQLESIGVDFSKRALRAKGKLSFKNLPEPACYRKGIMFCSNNSKGKALLDLFKKTKFNAKKVVFIDDKRKYLESVQEELAAAGIKDFTGIRYSFLDEKVKNFKFDPSKYIIPSKPIIPTTQPIVSPSTTAAAAA